jgi:hypothetical protein
MSNSHFHQLPTGADENGHVVFGGAALRDCQVMTIVREIEAGAWAGLQRVLYVVDGPADERPNRYSQLQQKSMKVSHSVKSTRKRPQKFWKQFSFSLKVLTRQRER